MQTHGDLARSGSWQSQPVVWLGIAVFAASLAGCLWLIVAAARYGDEPLDTRPQVFGVPTEQPRQPSPP